VHQQIRERCFGTGTRRVKRVSAFQRKTSMISLLGRHRGTSPPRPVACIGQLWTTKQAKLDKAE